MTEAAEKISEVIGPYGSSAPVGSDVLVAPFDDVRPPPSEERILVGELHHRLQNTLTIVLALSRMTARTVNTLDEFQTAFGQRIEAMARTNALLLQGQVQAVTVEAALEAELRPYLADNGQVTITSDLLEMSSEAALRLSLIVHELATNAAKYGALSTTSGRLIIECRRSELGGVLSWREHVTTPIAPISHRGSGSLLIDRLTRSLGGTLQFDLRPEGLEAQVSFELHRGQALRG